MKDVLRISIKKEFFDRLFRGDKTILETIQKQVPIDYVLFWATATNDNKAIDFLYHKEDANPDSAELEDFNIFTKDGDNSTGIDNK